MANKLELTWFGKEEKIKVEPRLLIENPELSNCKNNSETDNMLIHGDNLLALKALENKYTGKIKCIYIDPPYNTGAAFEHYDDNLEHSTWLNLMRPRLEIIKKLLCEEGSLWISLDDNEQAYCKVMCDEIFGRKNFICNVIWQKKFSPSNDAKYFSDNHDFILVYAKNKQEFKPNLLPRTPEMNARYKNPDDDPRGPWTSGDFSVKTYSAAADYPITTPSGRVVNPPAGYCWRFSKEKYKEMLDDNRVWFGKDGNNVPRVKRFLSEVKQGMTPLTIWDYKEVGHNQDAKKEVKKFNSKSVFTTPKPEKLIKKIITIATNENDIVLDSFLGSGTTTAVAQKMKRRYIGVEMGDHVFTHCKPRQDLVISGDDDGGVSKELEWTGGGSYKFYELAPSLIEKDDFDEYIINPEYDANMLAASVALNEGFNYQPDADIFWKQAKGNEDSYLYTTTRHITSDYLESIKNMMEEREFLIIACKSFDKNLANTYKNISLKKIPQLLLDKCEFGKDNYNLNIINPPVCELEDEEE